MTSDWQAAGLPTKQKPDRSLEITFRSSDDNQVSGFSAVIGLNGVTLL